MTDVETIPALQKRMMQTEKLRNAGLYHMSYEQAQLVFNIVTKRGDKWKGITKASKTSKLSRPTIYKLLRAFPEGLQ